MYADDNDQRLLNGIAGDMDQGRVTGWVGRGWGDYMNGGMLPKRDQINAIHQGTLWTYMKDEALYKCPTGVKGQFITYSIMDAMNGLTERRDRGSPFVINMMNINQPAKRLVFIDEGWVTPDSYAQPEWWDDTPCRHNKGVTFSLADGSSNFNKWTANETIQHGNTGKIGFNGDWEPTTEEGLEELKWMQKGCWGDLGY